jgi:isopentenyl-diphosphate delta-isomerase
MTVTNEKKVSFDDEMLVLVNPADKVIGYRDKLGCHLGDGILHRAFSIFIFNDKGQLLLQMRSNTKHLWPLFWSNSCCSHPRKGETMAEAVSRRLQEELGIDSRLTYLYKFQYQARFKDVGSENELCSVYVGKSNQTIKTNPNEISEWRFIDPEKLEQEIKEFPDRFTPWFKMEWERLRSEHWGRILEIIGDIQD